MTTPSVVGINGLSLPNRSGTGRVIEGLLDGLSRIPLESIRFEIVLPRGTQIKPGWAGSEQLSFHCIGPESAWGRLPWEQISLAHLARIHGVHLLHSPAFVAPVYGLGAVESVITVHDLAFLRYPKTIPLLKRLYYRWAIGASIRQASLILTDTETIRNEVINLGVNPERVHVLPLGVHDRFFSVSQDDVHTTRRKYDLPERYLLTVGTIEPRKNFEVLLDVMEKVPFDMPLILAGRLGWKYGTFKRRLKKNYFQNRIRLLDYISDEDLPALYSGAALFLAPSLYEGFGLTVLEAMAAGCPVIASDILAHREVGGDTIVYVAPEDTDGWIQAIENRIGLEDTNDAINRAREFSWTRHAEIYVEFLKNL